KPKDRLDFPATKEKGKMLPAYSYRLDENSRLAVWCFKNKKEIIIGDFANEYTKYVEEFKQPVEGDFSDSVLYLPLIHQKQVIGVITTQSFKKHAYSEYHINLLRNLATYAAIALDNASAYRQLNATLSELKTTQNQLIQQEKLASLGQLTAGIAHEIKNPLNFVNNFSDLSLELVDEAREEVRASMSSPFEGGKVPSNRDQGDDQVSDSETDSSTSDIPLNSFSRGKEILAILDDIETNLRKIFEHGTRADSIVKSMLLHSRGGSGEMESTDLNALIKEYANLAFHGMRASKDPINVDIELDLDENLGKIDLIAEDFSRVILNLCNNAFDAMRSLSAERSAQGESYEPKLSIQTHKKDTSVIIEIEDNGPGIPEEIKDKILQPFFTTKKGTAGTGLGLSITHDVIKAHGGVLDVKSKENEFTRFIIHLNKEQK
ncbi:MAG: ATP-binding protein, partial [Balneolaceae bacterium]|nr:ATP-binding protein [Balneolaceae bacterium]